MGRASRLTRLDAFSKTVEDARVRTSSGGIVTIVSVCVVLFLIIGEFRDYRTVVLQPELVVDKSRGDRLPIYLNITFPHIPCSLVTLDVMDISGEVQSDLSHGIHLTRLSKYPESKPVAEKKALDLHVQAEHLDPNYCGNCYGAPALPDKNGCCNTCDDVRNAYAAHGWAFTDGKGVEQCEKEHYAEHLAEMREEGCNVEGHLSVNKVVGNFHIAPGKSYSDAQIHLHDLQQYFNSPVEHTFTHHIHRLSFGPDLPEHAVKDSPHAQIQNPLDDTHHHTSVRGFNFMYFVKVVSTSYLPLGVQLGQHGQIDTHQYSVTSHVRNLQGGRDDEHPGALQARGGIPGVFFSYDISPMKVINHEVQKKTFVSFLTGICAIIGGTLTVAAAIDRGVYEGGLRIKKLHQG